MMFDDLAGYMDVLSQSSKALPTWTRILYYVFTLIIVLLSYDPTHMDSMPYIPMTNSPSSQTEAIEDNSLNSLITQHYTHPATNVEIERLSKPFSANNRDECHFASKAIFTDCKRDMKGVLNCKQNGDTARKVYCEHNAWKESFVQRKVCLDISQQSHCEELELMVNVCKDLSQRNNFCVVSLISRTAT